MKTLTECNRYTYRLLMYESSTHSSLIIIVFVIYFNHAISLMVLFHFNNYIHYYSLKADYDQTENVYQ